MSIASINANESRIAFEDLKNEVPDGQSKLNQAIQQAGAPSNGDGSTDISLSF